MKTINQITKSLLERDFKDSKIDTKNRKELIKKGLKIQKAKRIIRFDTGKIEGADNVAKEIVKKIKPEEKLIAIEGLSGVGKSATAEYIKIRLKAYKFSMGEIFRYLTYNPKCNINNFSYKIINNQLCLFDKKLNVTKSIGKILRSDFIDSQVPKIAKKNQKNVIEFIQKELLKIKTKKPILLEGRAFTLDFLPADLRIKLFANIRIRAKRQL